MTFGLVDTSNLDVDVGETRSARVVYLGGATQVRLREGLIDVLSVTGEDLHGVSQTLCAIRAGITPAGGGVGHGESQGRVVRVTVRLGRGVGDGLGETVTVRRGVAEARGSVQRFVGRQPGVGLGDGGHLVLEVVAAGGRGDELRREAGHERRAEGERGRAGRVEGLGQQRRRPHGPEERIGVLQQQRHGHAGLEGRVGQKGREEGGARRGRKVLTERGVKGGRQGRGHHGHAGRDGRRDQRRREVGVGVGGDGVG